MNKPHEPTTETNDGPRSNVDSLYKTITRFIEFYILLCFVLITFVPLLDYDWVPGFIWFTYITGFPLLVLLVLASFVKDALLDVLRRRIDPSESTGAVARRK